MNGFHLRIETLIRTPRSYVGRRPRTDIATPIGTVASRVTWACADIKVPVERGASRWPTQAHDVDIEETKESRR